MRTAILLTVLSTLLLSCNPTPNKEARIQKLEVELAEARQRINHLEETLQITEGEHVVMRERIRALEGELKR